MRSDAGTSGDRFAHRDGVLAIGDGALQPQQKGATAGLLYPTAVDGSYAVPLEADDGGLDIEFVKVIRPEERAYAWEVVLTSPEGFTWPDAYYRDSGDVVALRAALDDAAYQQRRMRAISPGTVAHVRGVRS